MPLCGSPVLKDRTSIRLALARQNIVLVFVAITLLLLIKFATKWSSADSINLPSAPVHAGGIVADNNALTGDARANHNHVLIGEENTAMNALNAACSLQATCISIHVFLQNRLDAGKYLLNALAGSDYSSYDQQVPLVIHLDRPSLTVIEAENGGNVSFSNQTLRTFEALQEQVAHFEWPHGPKVLDVKPRHVGLKTAWLTAWPEPRQNDVMIAFEDDMDVSPMYFKWLWNIMQAYKLTVAATRDPMLLGLSLSPIRMDEISYPFRPWQAQSHIAPVKFPVYLHAVPSSWGAVYFGNPWRDFLDFAATRDRSPFYGLNEGSLRLGKYGYSSPRGDPNLWLPRSRSNNWVGSWKRFMVDFAYGRGAYMLYPNLEGAAGLATSRFLSGVHVSEGRDRNPRHAPLVSIWNETGLSGPAEILPYAGLPLFDLHGQLISRANLSRRGDAFLDDIIELGPIYTDLVAKWRRPCLLDQVQNAITRHSPHSSPRGGAERFFIVAPQMGLNNQLTAVFHAFIWANILGRTLIVSHLIWPRASAPIVGGSDGREEDLQWVPYHEIFNLPEKSLFPRIKRVLFADKTLLRAWKKPRRVGTLQPPPNFDRMSSGYFSALGWADSPNVNLRSEWAQLKTPDDIYNRFGSCDDRVLVLDGLYQNPMTMDLHWGRLWSQVFQPMPMVKYLVEEVVRDAFSDSHATKLDQRNITSDKNHFACLHVRSTDFAAMCAAGNSGTGPLWMKKIYRENRRCWLSTLEVQKKIAELPHHNIILLSDEPHKWTPDVLATGKTVITSAAIHAKVAGLVPALRPSPSTAFVDVVSAITEQLTCARAEHIVINQFSTFSRSILWNRADGRGVEYW